MTTNRKYQYGNEEVYPDSVIQLDGKNIKNAATFRYLGSQVKHDENTTGDREVLSRIEAAKCKFAQMKNLLLNHDIVLSTRMTFLRAFVRSRLTYNCQNWVLTAEQTRKIDASWREFLRRMIKGGFRRQGEKDDDNFKFFYRNSDLHRICNTNDVSVFIKSQQRNYAAHLIRADSNLTTKKLLFQEDKVTKQGRNTGTLFKQVLANQQMDRSEFMAKAVNRVF